MQFIPIKTKPFLPPQDDIYEELDKLAPQLVERDVVCITSKVVGIAEGRTIKMEEGVDKEELIKQEAEIMMPAREDGTIPHLTVKEYTIVSSAGIDESNGNGYYILWPENATKSAKEYVKYLKEKTGLKELAVIIVDSHCIPLRSGIIGISTGFFGLEPIVSHIGKPDIFGREFKMSRTNVVDSIAVGAVYAMGETDETTPICIARNMPHVEFTDEDTYQKLVIEPKEDLYYPMMKPLYDYNERNE